jgi:hypothetical protein
MAQSCPLPTPHSFSLQRETKLKFGGVRRFEQAERLQERVMAGGTWGKGRQWRTSRTSPPIGAPTSPGTLTSAFSRALRPAFDAACSLRSSTSTTLGTPNVSKNTSRLPFSCNVAKLCSHRERNAFALWQLPWPALQQARCFDNQ